MAYSAPRRRSPMSILLIGLGGLIGLGILCSVALNVLGTISVPRSPAAPPTAIPAVIAPPTATANLAAANTSAPSTVAISPAAFASGGIGLSVADWERLHGAPNRGSASSNPAGYEKDKYMVVFWSGMISVIERQNQGPALPLEVLQAEAHAMLPADAKLVKTTTEPNALGGPDNKVELFMSPALATRYPSDAKTGDFPWWDVAPGTIAIVYDSSTKGWSIAAGYQNP